MPRSSSVISFIYLHIFTVPNPYLRIEVEDVGSSGSLRYTHSNYPSSDLVPTRTHNTAFCRTAAPFKGSTTRREVYVTYVLRLSQACISLSELS